MLLCAVPRRAVPRRLRRVQEALHGPVASAGADGPNASATSKTIGVCLQYMCVCVMGWLKSCGRGLQRFGVAGCTCRRQDASSCLRISDLPFVPLGPPPCPGQLFAACARCSCTSHARAACANPISVVCLVQDCLHHRPLQRAKMALPAGLQPKAPARSRMVRWPGRACFCTFGNICACNIVTQREHFAALVGILGDDLRQCSAEASLQRRQQKQHEQQTALSKRVGVKQHC